MPCLLESSPHYSCFRVSVKLDRVLVRKSARAISSWIDSSLIFLAFVKSIAMFLAVVESILETWLEFYSTWKGIQILWDTVTVNGEELIFLLFFRLFEV